MILRFFVFTFFLIKKKKVDTGIQYFVLIFILFFRIKIIEIKPNSQDFIEIIIH